MSHQSSLIATNIDEYLAQHERKELLRFITCGSVDDGKSTLIGRLFYESKMIYEDQLAAIKKDTSRYGTTGDEVDLALFTDGLEDERQQGITIDVAYRYFSTDKRKFIIADTPGHEQYTRNMATGASTADLAIILVDARHGVLTQTKRHSFIVSLLGIRHVVVAVNKMDIVGWDEAVFERIRADYQAFAARLELPDVHFLPISALEGDNVVTNSAHMPWYTGSPLMTLLETVYIGSDRNLEDFRFPVQLVLRPNLDFRGFAGTIASGIIRTGDEVMSLPSRRKSRVRSIVTFDGELAVEGDDRPHPALPPRRQRHHLVACADDPRSDRAGEAAEVEVRPEDQLHREAEVLQVAIGADVHRFQERHQRAAGVPRHVGAVGDDVVPLEGRDGEEVDVGQFEPRGEGLVVGADPLEHRLVPADDVHLVDRHHHVADPQQRDDEAVPLGLREDPVAGVDEDDRQVGGRGPGGHVARVLLVAGGVGDDELPLVGGEVAVGDVDRDPLLPLVLEAVGEEREIDLVARRAVAARVLLDRGELVFVDHLRFVEQPADERALAVVDAPAGDEPQQLLALVLCEVFVDVRGDQAGLM